MRGTVKNPFLTTLRYLSDGNRLYGLHQPGQALGIFVLGLYLPLVSPLLYSGVWADLGTWMEHVIVPSAGIVLACYGVVVAIVIAIGLTPPGQANLTGQAPYPVEQPVKSRIIINIRLFIVAMFGFNTAGIIFTQGLDRFEHIVCLALGGVLLQLGHLDEVNAVQIEPVLEQMAHAPLERYDQWYAGKWGQRPQEEARVGHSKILRWHILAVASLTIVHVLALLSYILMVHGPSGVSMRLPTVLFLCLTAGYITVRSYEAHLHSVMIQRHNSGSRFESRFSHSETYYALVLILVKIATTAAMAALPVLWYSLENIVPTALYLGLLVIDLFLFFGQLFLSDRSWLDPSRTRGWPAHAYERNYMLYLRRKHAAKQRATIRGAMKFASHHLPAAPRDPSQGHKPLPN